MRPISLLCEDAACHEVSLLWLILGKPAWQSKLASFACGNDLRKIFVAQVKLEFSHFLFFNSGAPLVLEGVIQGSMR
jgi:hypothetical protein